MVFAHPPTIALVLKDIQVTNANSLFALEKIRLIYMFALETVFANLQTIAFVLLDTLTSSAKLFRVWELPQTKHQCVQGKVRVLGPIIALVLKDTPTRIANT